MQPGSVVPSEVIAKFMLHLKITVDHKALVFVEIHKSILVKGRPAGRIWFV